MIFIWNYVSHYRLLSLHSQCSCRGDVWQTKLSASCWLDSRIHCDWEHNPEQLVREAWEQTVCVRILAGRANVFSLTHFGYTNILTAVEKSYKYQMEGGGTDFQQEGNDTKPAPFN